ncbi:hypothetical protein Q8A73_015102 [Channa argus]|nr:hypothetical protein Q8A73_015102 [Channa argus]
MWVGLNTALVMARGVHLQTIVTQEAAMTFANWRELALDAKPRIRFLEKNHVRQKWIRQGQQYLKFLMGSHTPTHVST